VDPEPRELLLYLGCNVLRTAHLARAAIDVLRAMGFEFHAVGGPAYCCGIVHHLHGERAAGRAFAGNSLRHFARFRPRHVIMWCPSCNEHYDEVVTRDHAVPFSYEHITAFIARHLDRVRWARRVERTVALHAHTGHPQQDLDGDATRTILQAIPGLRYVEIPTLAALGRHCSSNVIARIGRETWQRQVSAVLQSAAAAGAEILATIYHSCHRELCGEEARYPFAVVNWISLLAEAMGIDHPDLYKRFKLSGDPDAVFDEVRDLVAAHGLEPDRVREVLYRTFAPRGPAERPDSS